MKTAKELLNSKKVLIEKERSNHAKLVNEELLDIEKQLNKYERDLENTNPYIEIDRIVKTDEVKNLLKEKGYIIDTIGTIKFNTTRIWINEEEYNKKYQEDIIKNTIKSNTTNETKTNILDNDTLYYGRKPCNDIPEGMKDLFNHIDVRFI
ncbi:hypothetical protein DVV91_10065 [Clostridium botulinum]|uniref:hypothetical protein n=1 Tax=Clostridium botulinum TaxID=1491 RepID=UPI001968780F|nr:hypothetical protein [Clostridium botulinum]MBN1074686.1 hypothetical protein [Clostridium botulinum]